jgi:hypothetical protein
VYRRADLWRTFVLVVALLFTAVSTGAFAREFCGSGPHYERHPVDTFHSRRLGVEKDAFDHIRTAATGPNRTIVALIGTMAPLLVARLRRVEWI